jgi:hypothetical protein
MIELRRVSHNVYDVFAGTGWGWHSRVKRGKHDTFVMFGVRIPKHILKDLHQVLHPTLPITPGMTLEQTLSNLQHIN